MPGGMKFDTGKPKMDLLPAGPLAWVSHVLAFGAAKYKRGNWKQLDSREDWHRLLGATMRHVSMMIDGEWLDPESGLPHAAHVMCNCMFLLWHRDRRTGGDPFAVTQEARDGGEDPFDSEE